MIVAVRVSVTFKKILMTKLVNSPSWSILTFSKENVENVVSAPRNPVITNALYSGCAVWAKYIAANPIIKLPKILTLSVPIGKKEFENFWIPVASKNLEIAPKNPPAPINNKRVKFIICLLE